MTIKNIFTKKVTDELIARIEKISPQTQPLWGKMNVSQMLAHCCVSYELVYESARFPEPNWFMKFMIQLFVKSQVVGHKSYPKNSRTAPAFFITDERVFEKEKNKLIAFVIKTQELGESYFDNKESHSFGKLSAAEWNNMFYKHLDHHLGQFGV